MKTSFFYLLMFFWISYLTANTPAVVSNIITEMRGDDSQLVDIFYDVYDADGDTISIYLEMSDKYGASWNFTYSSVSGDIGDKILSGTNKHIIWNLGKEPSGIKVNDIRIRITADDGCPRTYGTVTDYDDNNYQTLVIGNQEWMVENLKVTHYNNGDLIPNLTDNDDWMFTTSGAYCVYDNDPDNADVYGNLYNGLAVTDSRRLAPEGWHVPTDDDIIELEMYLGMPQGEVYNVSCRGTNEGSKLAGSDDLWTDGDLENDPEFNSSGFNFLPGGSRDIDFGDFIGLGYLGYIWSSTEYSEYCCWVREVSYQRTCVGRSSNEKQIGQSVRCVKDSQLIGASNIIISPSGSGMSFSWEPVAGAISYKIYRSTDPYADISEMDMVAEITETNWTDPEALSADSYFYKVVTVFSDE